MGAFDPDLAQGWVQAALAVERPDVIRGAGEDDCAVLSISERIIVLTTDFVNFRPIALEMGIGGPFDLGRILVAANVSDLLGTGAKPLALMAGVAMPSSLENEFFQQIMLGVRAEADPGDLAVVGGDTKVSSSLSLFGVAVGTVEHTAELFTVDGGEAGDVIWTSGYVGSCSAAVLALSTPDTRPQLIEWARDVILQPSLPYRQSRMVATSHWGNAGTDLSDGLGADLHRLCHSSSVGAIVQASSIPIHPVAREIAATLGIEPFRLALGLGGDFQFVVTTKSTVRREMSNLGFIEIGRLEKGNAILLEMEDTSLTSLPGAGHRDARGLTFAQEVRHLLELPLSEE